jgi:hypothetical protein
MEPPVTLFRIPAWAKAAMCIAAVAALHLTLTNMQPLVPFQRSSHRPILVVEGVIIGIGALILRGIARRRHAIADMAATNAPPGGTILVSTDPIPWLPVHEPVEIGVAGGHSRASWPVRHDLILTPSYLVIRKWRTRGPGEVTVLKRSDIQGIYLVQAKNSKSWKIQRYHGPSVSLPFAFMFGQPSSAYEPVLAALAADAERAGQVLVNRRDGARLGMDATADRPLLRPSQRLDARHVIVLVIQIVIVGYILLVLWGRVGFP